jgi:hypothetical protein
MNQPAFTRALDAINADLAMLSKAKKILEECLGIEPEESTIPKDEKPKVKPVRSVSKVNGDTKTCNKCGSTKTLDDFPKHKECAGGRMGTCKECVRKRAKKYYHSKKSADMSYGSTAPV